MTEPPSRRDGSPASTPRRTVGVVGGMGPAATVDFISRVVASTRAERDQDHLHLVIDADPSIPDRTAFLLGDGESPVAKLTESAVRLERAGADFLVMACNTAHAFRADVDAVTGIPVVDWIAVASRFVAARAHREKTVGLLATTGTVRSRMYRAACRAAGARLVEPDEQHQALVMDVIAEVKRAGRGSSSASRRLERVVRHLRAAGAEAVLLACTELGIVRSEHDGTGFLLNASQIVAEHVIALAGGSVRTAAPLPAGARP